MNSKTLRSLSLSVISLAGQFGVRITVEQLEKKISQGQIKSEKELKNTLKDQGVKVQRLKPSIKTLIDRSYYFPCVALMRDGTAKILISCKSNAENVVEFQSMDPLDPSIKIDVENANRGGDPSGGSEIMVLDRIGKIFGREHFMIYSMPVKY